MTFKNEKTTNSTNGKTASKAKVGTETKEEDKKEGLIFQFQEKMKEEVVAVETAPASTEGTLTLQEIIASQLTDRKFAPVKAEELTKNVTYVTAGNGIFKVVKTPVALFKTCISETAGNIPGLPNMEEGVELLIPKIPFRKIIEAYSFYYDVNEKDKTEASLLFFWNHKDAPLPETPGLSAEGRLVTYCPEQVNSGALSDFTKDGTVPWLRENCAILLETHSHNVMSAFFSGTDDANENMNQFYAVWGKITDTEPDFIFRWVCGDRKVVCSPDVLIDWPTVTFREETISTKKQSLTLTGDTSLVDVEGDYVERVDNPEPLIVERKELVKGPFKKVDYPEDWMPQHSTRKYSYPASTYGTYGGSGSAWGKRLSYDAYTGYPEEYKREDSYDEWGSSYYDEWRDPYYGQESLLDEEEFYNFYEEEVPAPSFVPKKIPSIENRKVTGSSRVQAKIKSRKQTRKGKNK